MQAVQARTRITLKNILFTTDFSPAAEAAAPFAIQIASNYGAKVNGVHVNPFDNYTAAAPEAWAAMAEAADKETKKHARRLNDQLKGIEHEVIIGEGNIWEVISNLIKEKEIDLIANSWFSAPICQVLLQKNLTDCRGAPILSTWEDALHRQKAQAGSWPSSASRSNAAANGCGGLTTFGTCPSRPSRRPSLA